jgi:uncharacterized membrane protein YraQ (UPF0718 family)
MSVREQKEKTRELNHVRRGHGMLISIIIMGGLAVGLLALGYFRGKGDHIQGLRLAADMLVKVLPLLLFAFIIAGMVQTLVPRDTISHWVGKESGIRGIMIGCFAGSLVPGGPYVSLPVTAGLLRAGVGVGTAVAFLTAWSLWSVTRLPLEIGIVGPRFTLIRIASTFFFPPIAGLIAKTLFERS